MNISIYSDGGSRNNPGPAAAAFIIYKDNNEICHGGKYLGVATNNVAEYAGLILALKKLSSLSLDCSNKTDSVVCYSDSSLMINQVNGLFKVKDSNLKDLLIQVRLVEREINFPIRFVHIPRDKNKIADSLVNKILDSQPM